ncbi:glycosyltransferase family 4 protein [Candidatus Thiothrix anitrata]|uniref:glycosyltransferase family 4 protein n=1 Tax=Candidatus Thiothrix anitrata TaxID=2823902 RepID=UPI002B1BE36D|nr:glycosyltransferase family 4 protein [Candidatus Thiothrix anitrata]
MLTKKSIKIALIRQRYNPFGGAERFVERIIKSSNKYKIQITLITRKWPNTKDTKSNTILLCNPFYIGSLWRDWSFSRCIKRQLKKNKFNLIQSHERLCECDIYRAGDGVHREWLNQRNRSTSLWQKLLISINPYHVYIKNEEAKLFKNKLLKKIICNSNMVKDEIKFHYQIPDSKITIIRNGLDFTKFHPSIKNQYRNEIRLQHNISNEDTLFLFVGSGFSRKGLESALKALSKLPKNTYLLIIGKDKKEKYFIKKSNELDIRNRVIFLEGKQNVIPYYSAADVFILPTIYDPFPNATLEAMACGLPVITSYKSGTSEIITHGKMVI